jgi:hypothetical protein
MRARIALALAAMASVEIFMIVGLTGSSSLVFDVIDSSGLLR